MTIETKFNVKDHAFAIIENELKYVDILDIIIHVDYNFNIIIQYEVEYWSYGKRTQDKIKEKRLFSTREELIKSL